MSLPALCIRRPVFTIMLCLLPVVLGLIALRGIGVDLFPNVDLPIVIVTTNRPGTSVEEMETGVTKVIEEAVNTISSIDELRSTTTEGRSVVTVQFLLSKDRDIAQQEVQSKVNTIISQLPPGTETPIIDKFDVDAAPVMTVAISGTRDLKELSEIANRQIAENLSSLAGVGSVTLVGGRPRAINVTIDTARLEAFGLSITDVRDALARQNLELPGGRVDQQRRELVLRTVGRVQDPRQFADIIVANIEGQPIRIRDLGPPDSVQDSVEEPRSLARLDGRNAVSLIVQKQSGENTVQVIDTVKARLKILEESFAREGRGDIKMVVIRDQSRFINGSLHEVQVHMLLGAALVVITILLFLRDWRPTVIAAIAIPVSIIAIFPIMRALDLTLNNITLIAMVLMIGVVVDDAVVVIENIFRWMEEEHRPPREAALKGTHEIMLAVIATSLSLFVIFLPIAFMTGVVGKFLRSFGITCAIAVLVSLAVSITLTPMMSSRLLRLKKKRGEREAHAPHGGLVYTWLFERPYMTALRWSLRHRWAVVLATIASVALIFPLPLGKWISLGSPQRAEKLAWMNYPGLLFMVGFDFIPKDDQSEFEIAITAPEGWSLEKASDVFDQIERRLYAMPEIVHVLTQIGDTSGRAAAGEGPVTEGTIYVRLVELGDRSPAFTQFRVMDVARAMMRDYPDLRASVQVPAVISAGTANADVEFQLTGPDLTRLNDYADRIVATLRATPGLADVDTTLKSRKPELRVIVDRERASDLGVQIQDIASALRTLVGGQIISDFKDESNGEQYDVWLRAIGTDRNDARAVSNLTLRSPTKGLARLSSVASTVETLGPSQIDRAQRQRKISIKANLAGMPTGTASSTFMQAFESLNPPPVYQLSPVGRAKNQAESVSAFFLAFLLSLVFMYMILAAQFESLVHPITILLAVPLTVPFALLSLLILGTPLTLFSVLGLFLLFGVVKKNGILQVDYTNVLRRRAAEDPAVVPAEYRVADSAVKVKGFRRWLARLSEGQRVRTWAVLQANRTRLRPILMTTVMLIAAMIPIALGQGPGAANRAEMAKVIVGGQALSLLLSLLVTPVAYSLFDDWALFVRRRFGAKGPSEGSATPTAGAMPAPSATPT
ncbi:MAG: efflux RND transporter permease subunit [Phycisphaerales bacterium]